MKIQSALIACTLAAAVAGCSKSDDATTNMSSSTTPGVPSTQPGMMDQAKTNMSNAADTVKDKASDVSSAAADKMSAVKSSAASAGSNMSDKMSAMSNNAMGSTGNAKDAMVAGAQKYYDQAKDYINSKNFSGASDMTAKLESMKDQLPDEWKTKVTELSAMLSKAKADAGNAMTPSASPTTMP